MDGGIESRLRKRRAPVGRENKDKKKEKKKNFKKNDDLVLSQLPSINPGDSSTFQNLDSPSYHPQAFCDGYDRFLYDKIEVILRTEQFCISQICDFLQSAHCCNATKLYIAKVPTPITCKNFLDIPEDNRNFWYTIDLSSSSLKLLFVNPDGSTSLLMESVAIIILKPLNVTIINNDGHSQDFMRGRFIDYTPNYISSLQSPRSAIIDDGKEAELEKAAENSFALREALVTRNVLSTVQDIDSLLKNVAEVLEERLSDDDNGGVSINGAWIHDDIVEEPIEKGLRESEKEKDGEEEIENNTANGDDFFSDDSDQYFSKNTEDIVNSSRIVTQNDSRLLIRKKEEMFKREIDSQLETSEISWPESRKVKLEQVEFLQILRNESSQIAIDTSDRLVGFFDERTEKFSITSKHKSAKDVVVDSNGRVDMYVLDRSTAFKLCLSELHQSQFPREYTLSEKLSHLYYIINSAKIDKKYLKTRSSTSIKSIFASLNNGYPIWLYRLAADDDELVRIAIQFLGAVACRGYSFGKIIIPKIRLNRRAVKETMEKMMLLESFTLKQFTEEISKIKQDNIQILTDKRVCLSHANEIQSEIGGKNNYERFLRKLHLNQKTTPTKDTVLKRYEEFAKSDQNLTSTRSRIRFEDTYSGEDAIITEYKQNLNNKGGTVVYSSTDLTPNAADTVTVFLQLDAVGDRCPVVENLLRVGIRRFVNGKQCTLDEYSAELRSSKIQLKRAMTYRELGTLLSAGNNSVYLDHKSETSMNILRYCTFPSAHSTNKCYDPE